MYFEATDILRCTHQKRVGQYADEPFYAAAMGKVGILPVSYDPTEGSIMVTTWNAKNCQVALASNSSHLDKVSAFWVANRFLPRSYVAHSPTIMHFIGLKPDEVYGATSKELRATYGVS